MRDMSPMTNTRNPSSEFSRDVSSGKLLILNCNQLGIEAPEIEVKRSSGTITRMAKWSVSLDKEDSATIHLAFFNTKSDAIAHLRSLWKADKMASQEEEE